MHSLVYLEPTRGKIDPLALQLAAKLRSMPEEERGTIRAVALGAELDGAEALSGRFDELLLAEVRPGDEQSTEVAARVLTDVMGDLGPGLLFFGFTHQGMELAPAVGARLGVPVLTGCTDLRLSDGLATAKRLLHGGKVSATYEVPIAAGAVFSVPKGVLRGAEAEGAAAPSSGIRVVNLARREAWRPDRTELVELVEEAADGQEITRARVLVSVGRGIGSPEELPLFRELARTLDAALSCSRPVVDLGWLPASHQVGLSGKTVSPVVYLAVGISGQGNHLAGMESSKIIIAVNKDPAAPIFQVAHYGVLDDLHKFVPALLEQAKKEAV
ncbi:MAG: electron transfer flavoprotein subunit alpha/FixB family protein [Deltaproteobacteria bacterium]|nr:electron transfer flavoprotein subunit alpha/FixB family protein [Deltaproteobacteria bacterium]